MLFFSLVFLLFILGTNTTTALDGTGIIGNGPVPVSTSLLLPVFDAAATTFFPLRACVRVYNAFPCGKGYAERLAMRLDGKCHILRKTTWLFSQLFDKTLIRPIARASFNRDGTRGGQVNERTETVNTCMRWVQGVGAL